MYTVYEWQDGYTVHYHFLKFLLYNLPFNAVGRGLYWFHLVHPSICLSVCGQNRVGFVSSTILVRSIAYLHILSSNFRRCVTCIVCFKVQQFGILANSLNLQLWLFHILIWDPIWLNSVGNHEAAGVSSEWRCSSCSRFRQFLHLASQHSYDLHVWMQFVYVL